MDAKALRRLLPSNAQDAAAAKALVAMGAEEVAPLVPQLLRQMKDHKSPVAQIYCAFFVQEARRFGSEVGHALARRTLPEVRHKLLTCVLPLWPRDALVPLTGVLQMLVSHTDGFDTDLHAMRLLSQHQLCDADWLCQWLRFKNERLRARTSLAEDIGRALK